MDLRADSIRPYARFRCSVVGVAFGRPPPGRRNSPYVGCFFLFAQKETKNAPGAGSEERQRSSRPPPDPRYGGRFPGNRTATPARLVQLIDCASAPLPLAG